MSEQQAIIVGVDGTIRSIEASRWAATEARRHGYRLELVHAVYQPYDPDAPEQPDAADGALLEAFTAATEAEPLVEVTTIAPRMAAVKYLIERSVDAALLVLGSHSSSSMAGAIFGSIAQTVAAHATCPVAIVAKPLSPEPDPSSPVVVGVSPHPGGMEALRFAFTEARLRGVDLIAIRSWGDVDWATGRLGYNSELFDEWRRMELNVLNECLAEVEGEFTDVPVHRALRGVRAQVALQEAATKAQLLVVGTHRRDDHWFSRLGPVPSWLLHHAPCPLVIVGQPHLLAEERSLVPDTAAATT